MGLRSLPWTTSAAEIHGHALRPAAGCQKRQQWESPLSSGTQRAPTDRTLSFDWTGGRNRRHADMATHADRPAMERPERASRQRAQQARPRRAHPSDHGLQVRLPTPFLGRARSLILDRNSPGRERYRNMGSRPVTDPEARLWHRAQGSWRSFDIEVEYGKICRTLFARCRDWPKTKDV